MLLEQKEYLVLEREEKIVYELDKLGLKYLNLEMPEIIVLRELMKSNNKDINKFSICEDEIKGIIGILKKNKLCEIRLIENTNNLNFSITENGKIYLEKNGVNPLLEIEKNLDFLKIRKGFIKQKKEIDFKIILSKTGEKISKEIKLKYSNLELIESLTINNLKTRNWKECEFKSYDVNVKTSIPEIGREHPMHEANKILGDIFVEMGFCEMEGPIVESEFWCFDALWIPQDHPPETNKTPFF